MRRRLSIAAVLSVLVTASAAVVAQRAPARRPAQPAAPATTTAPGDMVCPAPLGVGVNTKREFCDVLSGRDPAEGIIITLPPHRGDVTLSFDLHNRHTYSEELVKSGSAYRRYTAMIGALTMDNTLISRAVVQSEFRTAADLLDRIGGGAGPGGIKAVAPVGSERIVLKIPAAEQKVSLLGERLTVARPDASEPDVLMSPGRPIAVVSNVTVEYRPGPAPKPAPPPRRPGN